MKTQPERGVTMRGRLVAGFTLVVLVVVGLSARGYSGEGMAMDTGASRMKLIMVEELGCPYCELWDEEIGVVYNRTPEGKFAPLERVLLGEPTISHLQRVVYAPTFLVMDGRREIGRIVGYSGEDFFWPMLDEILKKVGFGRQLDQASGAVSKPS